MICVMHARRAAAQRFGLGGRTGAGVTFGGEKKSEEEKNIMR